MRQAGGVVNGPTLSAIFQGVLMEMDSSLLSMVHLLIQMPEDFFEVFIDGCNLVYFISVFLNFIINILCKYLVTI